MNRLILTDQSYSEEKLRLKNLNIFNIQRNAIQ